MELEGGMMYRMKLASEPWSWEIQVGWRDPLMKNLVSENYTQRDKNLMRVGWVN